MREYRMPAFSPKLGSCLVIVCKVRLIKTICIYALSMAAFATGCGSNHEAPASGDDVLVSIGDSTLRLQDVVRRIPSGLDKEDSIQMFHNIVDSWVGGLVLSSVAERNITDMQRIEKLVENYRNRLIINEYFKLMSERVNINVKEEAVKDYYESNLSEFTLTQPLVKGALVRVDENDRVLPDLRRWLTDFSDDAVDNIEKTGLRHATAYEYFGDSWHEWGAVAERIPYRFFDADAFVKSTVDFETSADGSVYLLHISDFLPSGSVMPYEFARLKIAEMMRVSEINNSRSKLKADIYRRMIREGTLKPGLYDPVKGEMCAQGDVATKKK